MKKKRFRGLFINAVLVLTLISLVPLVFIGIHLTRVNSRILQHEIFQKQQTIASRLTSLVHSYFTHTTQYFAVFIDLHTDFGGHASLNEQDLIYLQQKEPAAVYLGVLNTQGDPVFSVGESVFPDGDKAFLPQILHTCVRQREDYMGNAHFVQGRGWFIRFGFPIYEMLERKQVTGVLLVDLSLTDLGRLLSSAYPLEMEAIITSAMDQVVAYNGAPEGLVEAPSQELTQTAHDLQMQLGSKNTGEAKLSDGRRWLVATADVSVPDWKVYIAQPANLASKLLFESTIHSVGSVLRIILIMGLFILGVSYWVIVPISRPLERLRKAALRLREGDAIIRREDVEIPQNEIGDLAEVFVEMAEVLHFRRQELLYAQKQLSMSNLDLEKRVEERTRELKETTNELVKKERLAAIGQLAAIISHEIRNPLAVISNATRLIKMSVQSPEPRVVKQFSIIETEIKQANSIISEVLGYARSRDLILSLTDVSSYVHDILASYPFGSGIKVKEELASQPARIKIDTEEMKQALRNLIANAVESMQQQGTITVGTKVGRKVVCIYVADTGPGIPEDIRQKMFTPFFTTKARGTGLGLAVVGKALARHCGKMFITSEPGKGSCFQIYLRIYQKKGDTLYGTTDKNLSGGR